MTREFAFARTVAVGLVGLAATGCVSHTPVVLPVTSLAPGVTAPTGSCQVDLLAARDVRQHPETLGTIWGRPVRSPDNPREWLGNVLQGLRELDIEVTEQAGRRDTSSLAIEAELRDAWVSALSTAKTANVIVHIRYLPSDGEALEKLYRGRDSSMNWTSGDAPVRAMMDRVFADIREQLARDIRPFCP